MKYNKNMLAITPTLVRLSFWLTSERIAEFEAVYQKEIAPFLLQRGLVESSERGRKTLEGVFSRLFEVETLAEVKGKAESLRGDPAWSAMLRSLGATFGSADADGRIPYNLDPYMVPSGPGTVVRAGQGRGCWRTFDGSNGLPDNWVHCILQDRDGNIWFATESGACRYDGYRLTTFTTKDGLPSNSLGSIIQDRHSHLWFAASIGVGCYHGQNSSKFTRVDKLASDCVSRIYEDKDGQLWFGTGGYNSKKGNGVIRYDGRNWFRLTTEDGLAHDSVLSITQTRDGALWFGTHEGASRYDGKRFITFTTADGLAHNLVYSITQDSDGRLWFAGPDGVSCYDGQTWTTLTTEDGLASNVVECIFQDADGIFWFCTNLGMSRYDGRTFTTLTSKDGLAGDLMNFVFQDAEGALWFAGDGGVNRYERRTMVTFTTQDGLAQDWVRIIQENANGFLWFAAPGGISRYDGRTFTNFTIQDGIIDDDLQVMLIDTKGQLWIGTWSGYVQKYDGRTWTTFTREDGLSGQPIFGLAEDRDGCIWICGYGGACRYDGQTFTAFGSFDNQVRSMFQDREGNLWFGTWGSGAWRYDGQSWVTSTTKDGLAEDRIQENCGIYQDRDGNIWFGTRSGGVSRYDGQSFTTFTTADGLPNNCVSCILQDSEGYLWFGTNGGACVFDGQVFQTFTQQDGLGSNCVWSIFQDREGDIWIGTVKGVTRYRRPTPKLPRAFIDAVVGDQRYIGVNVVTVPSNVGLVVFEFHGESFRTRPEAMVYRYRLTGRHGWQNTKERRVEYLELPPGDYTFEVQTVDQHLAYSEPATVTLTVQPDPQVVALKAEINHLRSEVSGKYDFGNIIGRSEPIKQVRALMERAIDSGLAVLIIGETGTGKELVAKAIHYSSPRRDCPLKDLNCGAVPEQLVSSTLFGHRKGAFTGATEDRIGLFEAASGGTLLLDEIGEMPQDAQLHLLRVLEENKIQRVGENTSRDVDVRVIAMTNQDLIQEMKDNRFRKDLYYRLSVFPIHIPPLRERMEDVPLLVEHFLKRACEQQSRELKGFSPGAMDMLKSYSWPGNIRELEHEIYRAVALAEDGSYIQTYHFSSQLTQGESLIQSIISEKIGLSESLELLQRRLIENALKECNGNRTRAARMLNTQRPNLLRIMKRLGID
jgi:DNA-binding NtrC family response regulator/ligand-binding sensor domain-containing protein